MLLKAIEAAGWSTKEGLLSDEPLWREIGRFDERGHVLGADLATQAHDLLVEVADIALQLAQKGRRVRIVTDHGWLLMPDGLPQAQLVSGLTVAGGKGHRVATLKEGALTTYPRLPWSWDKGVSLATATGARAFYAGVEYAHGGVSPQECVLPVLDIVAEPAAAPVIIKPTWRRLRLNVEVQGGAGLMFDVRLGSDVSGDSILPKGARLLDDLGQVGVLIPDDMRGTKSASWCIRRMRRRMGAPARDVQRHRVYGPDTYVSAGLGHPEGKPRPIHRPLRAGFGRSRRDLLSAAVAGSVWRVARACASRRGAVGP